jgi:membrane protease YdiL (CAAX protease family)
MDAVSAWVRRSLWEEVPRDHREPSLLLRRRQWTVACFAAAGAVALALTLHLAPGDPWFYPATFLLAAVWIVGARLAGPLHLGRIAAGGELRRPVLAPVVIGLALAAVFALAAVVVRDIPYLGGRVAGVLDYAGTGSLPVLLLVTALNGVAEELFFRGALYAAIPRRPLLWSTLAYTLITLATGNVMLALAAAALGVIVGLERRASGGVLAPVLTHVAWSAAVLLVLPPLF